jgi:hypothetical protein
MLAPGDSAVDYHLFMSSERFLLFELVSTTSISTGCQDVFNATLTTTLLSHAYVGTHVLCLDSRKDTLFYSAGSNWGFRPAIRACISKNLGRQQPGKTNLKNSIFFLIGFVSTLLL